MSEASTHYIRCAELCGGTKSVQTEVCTSVLNAAIQSRAHEGESGGDIYYFSVCSYDKLTRMVIADLRGHGEEANLLSSWLYRALEERMNSLDGAGVLQELNGLVKAKGFSAITTALVATYYRDAGKLYFSYAGHPPMVLRRDGANWNSVPLVQDAGVANLPLGILEQVRYDQAEVEVQAGDRIALFTDGVVERADANGDLFGESRLIAALERANAMTLTKARDEVLTEVENFGEPDDDVTLMLVELR